MEILLFDALWPKKAYTNKVTLFSIHNLFSVYIRWFLEKRVKKRRSL